MYEQVLDPVGGSLFASALFAAVPLITLFVLLGGLKLKAHWAALASLAMAIIVAVVVYSMPGGQALNAAVLGACFGLFPIMWIVWNAIWIYNMTVATGHFQVKLSRQPRQRPPYPSRLEEAERWRAELFLSLHSDARGEARKPRAEAVSSR